MYDFLIYALLAGLGLTLMTSPLGAFVVWRRMAYFGDTLAHAALLGVALGFILHMAEPLLAITLTCLFIGLLLMLLERRPQLARDSILGILSHSALALGVILVAMMPSFRADLYGYLFGDILSVSPQDLVVLYVAALAVLALLAFNWRNLISMVIHQELAKVEGVPVRKLQLLFVMMLAVVIAIAMKLLGVLLITAMLIIPPVAARPFSKTPEQMVGLGIIIGMIAVVLGLAGSWFLDMPAGPSIVVAASIQFALSQLVTKQT